jgi:hypothetical protein
MKGYIKLHRTILDWEWYKDTNTKILFIHLLLNACFDRCKFMGVYMLRGQYITSMSRLSNELGLTSRQLRTAISRLKKTKEINVKTTNKFTLFTVCNYENYQFEEQRNNATILTESHNDSYYNACIKNAIWIEQVCVNQKLNKEQLEKALEKFNNYLNLTNDFKSNLKQYKSHFINWTKYNIKTIAKSSGTYQWKWKGQAVKHGTKTDLEKDKSIFDKPGFEFKILKNGN